MSSILEKLVDKTNVKVKLKNTPITNEETISITYGCMEFFDSYRFLSMALDELVENLDKDDLNILKKKFPDERQYLNLKNVMLMNFLIILIVIIELLIIWKKKTSLVK